jgi:glycosyltransferase involved in cell wall biosynthesis
LSVIIASYNSRHTIEGCLQSLEDQKSPGNFEIIVVDSSTDGTGDLLERVSRVKVFRYSERKFAGDARNVGIANARGKVLAFIDADCRATENWVEGILNAHHSPHLAIGGAIANGNPESYVGWAAYFCEFNQWMPGTQPMWLHDIAGANMSYKREAFQHYGGFIEGTYCSDTDFHWRLVADGHRLRFVPSIIVLHHNIDKLGNYLKHEYFHGNSFAKVRIQGKRFSRKKTIMYAFLSPLIPLKLFIRIGLQSIRNRIYLLQFLKSFPLLLLGLALWSLGEMAGYVKGYKRSAGE